MYDHIPVPPVKFTKSTRIIYLDDEGFKDGCALYLSYRVVEGFKTAVAETVKPDITWQECSSKIATTPILKIAAEDVLARTLTDYYNDKYPDFGSNCEEATWPVDSEHDDPDAKMRWTAFCSLEKMLGYVDLLFFYMQYRYYEYLYRRGIVSEWEPFISELLKKGELWNVLDNHFKLCLERLDFSTMWKSHDLDVYIPFI